MLGEVSEAPPREIEPTVPSPNKTLTMGRTLHGALSLRVLLLSLRSTMSYYGQRGFIAVGYSERGEDKLPAVCRVFPPPPLSEESPYADACPVLPRSFR
jgi:hypothetical protein